MNKSLESFYDELSQKDNNAIFSEQTHQNNYQKCLTDIRNNFSVYNKEIDEDLDKLLPFLALDDRLEQCNGSEAMIVYCEISKGFQVASYLYGKTQFNLNKANSEYKAVRGKHYLERFPNYVNQMKNVNMAIKDTDAAREHYLNQADDVLQAKEKVDFLTAYSITLDGMKNKLFSDMTHARNICYQKRYMDQLPTAAS